MNYAHPMLALYIVTCTLNICLYVYLTVKINKVLPWIMSNNQHYLVLKIAYPVKLNYSLLRRFFKNLKYFSYSLKNKIKLNNYFDSEASLLSEGCSWYFRRRGCRLCASPSCFSFSAANARSLCNLNTRNYHYIVNHCSVTHSTK